MDTKDSAAAQRQISLYIPESIHEALRVEAFERRVPMTHLIRDALEKFLQALRSVA